MHEAQEGKVEADMLCVRLASLLPSPEEFTKVVEEEEVPGWWLLPATAKAREVVSPHGGRT